MKIAIVGSGISGLTAAYRLQADHRVVLFESAHRPGGHTHTVDVFEGERPIPVDTGFIVFNTKTYPNFVKLMGDLGIGWAPSNMGFSVHSAVRNFEYSGQSLSGLFAQRKRAFSLRFLRMVNDIFRFYREAHELLADGTEIPMLEWLIQHRYSEGFIEDHFFPLLRAIWSADRRVAEEFPARFLVRFFENHGFLQVRNAPQWLTIPGGARTYVRSMLASFTGELRLKTPVRSVRRTENAVWIATDGLPEERFDHVVMACHSTQALRMVADASDLEKSLLEAFPYQKNEAVLHTDEKVMPNHKRTWSAWNVHLDDTHAQGACLTYWMNRLQPLGAKKNYFVSLNHTANIHPDKIIHQQTYEHPVFTAAGTLAQARHQELINHRHTSYAGAYWRNGFHEDGVVSALRVVDALRNLNNATSGMAA